MNVIGITGNFGERGCELAEGYYESLVRVGATPVVLPPVADTAVLDSWLNGIDALLLSGGGDINPLLLGEEPIPELHSINPRRDACELRLTRMVASRHMPILGICRGCQVIAAALGGTLYQDINTQQTPTAPRVKHNQDMDRACASHTVALAKASRVRAIFNNVETLHVNSFHHQAVAQPGSHLRVSATAADGVVEAIESTEGESIIGVQWHPECFCLRGDETMLPLFRWLAKEAEAYARARRFHQTHITFDSHCDTPMLFDEGVDFFNGDARALVDLPKMQRGGLDATTMVAYIPQGPLTTEGREAAFRLAESRLDGIDRLAKNSGIALACRPDELLPIKLRGGKAIMRGIENGYAIGLDLTHLDHFVSRGIVYMTLCHNGNNDICGSARPREGEPTMGLTDFGAEVVRRMNQLGILVDLSHASQQSFFDALQLSTTPIVCSHSSARALCNHPRNLTDEQLRALAARGGVAQVTFYDGFLREGGGADINDAVAHLRHMASVMGVEHVGIGTDFDGDGGVPGLASAAELMNFTLRLLDRHFTADELDLIWGGNFLRVMREAQGNLNSE